MGRFDKPELNTRDSTAVSVTVEDLDSEVPGAGFAADSFDDPASGSGELLNLRRGHRLAARRSRKQCERPSLSPESVKLASTSRIRPEVIRAKRHCDFVVVLPMEREVVLQRLPQSSVVDLH